MLSLIGHLSKTQYTARFSLYLLPYAVALLKVITAFLASAKYYIFVNICYITLQTVATVILQYIGVLLMTGFNKPTPPVLDDRNAARFGFTPQSENWNGRFAMIGFLSVVLIEVFSGQGFLHFWGIL